VGGAPSVRGREPAGTGVRLADAQGPLGAGQTRTVTVTGKFGSSPAIPTGVSAILCNLTCASPSGAGFLAMFQAGTSWSGTSNVNFNNGQDISNNATTAISPGSPGQVAVLCGAGATNFVVDVFGYDV
jgi:hypothetical protein